MVCLLQDSEKRRERRDAEMISSEMKMANKEFIKVSLLKRLYVFFYVFSYRISLTLCYFILLTYYILVISIQIFKAVGFFSLLHWPVKD